MNDYTLPVIGFVIALSGWAKVLYDYVTSRAKIRGQVFQLITGQMNDPRTPGKRLEAFITYLYLVNKRRNTIHILDYELEVKVDDKWTRLGRVYGLHNVKSSFGAIGGGNIEIKNFEDNLIYRKGKPAEYGQPLHGWIVFAGSEDLHGVDIAAYRLTCIDAFRKKQRFVTKKEELAPLYLLQDMEDVKTPSPRDL
jgi:hypothetical protein